MEIIFAAAAIILLGLYLNSLMRTYRLSKGTVSRDKIIAELNQEKDRARENFEDQTRTIREEAEEIKSTLEPLRQYASIADIEAYTQRRREEADLDAQRVLTEAISEANSLRSEAQKLIEQARAAGLNERTIAKERAKDIQEQADALLNQAIKDSAKIAEDANKRAEQIAGDAYEALRDKQTLEQAVQSLWNVTDGYGDRFVIPTHSLLDDLAAEFGYDSAGQALKSSRDLSRRMVEQKLSAACDYEEDDRRERANRFITDAFNGRVDAVLSRVKHDNYGTLRQEIVDAFNLVNLNGLVFHNARVLPAYLDARLAELKWAVVVKELIQRIREEQRYLREQERDRQKAEEERQRKLREAAKEKELVERALADAEKKFAQATAEQKAETEQELQELRKKLAEATTRELTIAQQTNRGFVYVISNIGSFGEGVYKIGLTRRQAQERVDELSSASVPFEYDIHAIIETENAPALEYKLHKHFLAQRMNKINLRKEFFRVNLSQIREAVEELQHNVDYVNEVAWTLKADAQQYYETTNIDNDPAAKDKWLQSQAARIARQRRQAELGFSTATQEPITDGE